MSRVLETVCPTHTSCHYISFFCLTAVSVVVLNEVFVRTVEYAEQNLPERHPDHADHFYGYSFILSWIVFVFYIAAFLVFLFLSHKRKTEMADVVDKLAEEDEPMRLGR